MDGHERVRRGEVAGIAQVLGRARAWRARGRPARTWPRRPGRPPVWRGPRTPAARAVRSAGPRPRTARSRTAAPSRPARAAPSPATSAAPGRPGRSAARRRRRSAVDRPEQLDPALAGVGEVLRVHAGQQPSGEDRPSRRATSRNSGMRVRDHMVPKARTWVRPRIRRARRAWDGPVPGRGTGRRHGAAGAAQPSSAASRVISTPVSALLTGQPALASWAAFSKPAASRPSTSPRTVSVMPVSWKPRAGSGPSETSA